MVYNHLRRKSNSNWRLLAVYSLVLAASICNNVSKVNLEVFNGTEYFLLACTWMGVIDRRWAAGDCRAVLVLAGQPGPLGSNPKPAADYDEAVQRVQAFQAQELSGLTRCARHSSDPWAKSPTGSGTCARLHHLPQPVSRSRPRLYDLGYNVLMVPMPHHGLAERMTEEQSRLTAEELANYADHIVDIAQGLGEQVTMVGISGGGVTTAWAAQHRSDLALRLFISPAFGYAAIPTPFTVPALHAYLWLPNSYQWWDTARQEAGGQPYAYPRWTPLAPWPNSSALGLAVMADARREPPPPVRWW